MCDPRFTWGGSILLCFHLCIVLRETPSIFIKLFVRIIFNGSLCCILSPIVSLICNLLCEFLFDRQYNVEKILPYLEILVIANI